MPQLILLFNHNLSDDQQISARQQLGATRFMSPPPHLQDLWGAIPADEPALRPLLTPITEWLDQVTESGDLVLIQGDFGACYLLVKHALEKHLVPVYATTTRVTKESVQADGSVRIEHVFRHVCFRKYDQ
jgi:hypothetical protein